MFTCRLRPPSTITCPTPVTLSSWRRTTLSANSVISRTGLLAMSAMLSTGAESGSMRSMRGWRIVFGRRGRTLLILSRTSCAATSAGLSSRNRTMTIEMPSDDVDRSSSMPLMVLTDSSIKSVTSVSICSGAAPGCIVVTMTIGKSALGIRSTPSCVKEKAPITVRERMSTAAKTGRRTQRAASHCMVRTPFDCRRAAQHSSSPRARPV